MEQKIILSVVMPVYNEGEVIEKIIREIFLEILEKFENAELITIDDCSSDATPLILKKLKLEYPSLKVLTNKKNLGHGPSLIRGYQEAKGEYVFCLDSDNQIPIKNFWLLWDKMQKENLDIVTGVRKERKDPGYRLLISKILRFFVKTVFKFNFKDINCPFKVFKKEALEKILTVIPPETLIPSILMLIVGAKFKFKIGEVNVEHFPRKTGKSLIKSLKILKICFLSLKELIKFKMKL